MDIDPRIRQHLLEKVQEKGMMTCEEAREKVGEFVKTISDNDTAPSPHDRRFHPSSTDLYNIMYS